MHYPPNTTLKSDALNTRRYEGCGHAFMNQLTEQGREKIKSECVGLCLRKLFVVTCWFIIWVVEEGVRSHINCQSVSPP